MREGGALRNRGTGSPYGAMESLVVHWSLREIASRGNPLFLSPLANLSPSPLLLLFPPSPWRVALQPSSSPSWSNTTPQISRTQAQHVFCRLTAGCFGEEWTTASIPRQAGVDVRERLLSTMPLPERRRRRRLGSMTKVGDDCDCDAAALTTWRRRAKQAI